MRRPSTFKKADLTRAAKAVQAAGLEVRGVEVSRDGFSLITGQPGGTVQADARDDLDRELAEFRAQHDED